MPFSGLPLWILIRLFLVKIQSSMIVSRYVSNTNLDYTIFLKLIFIPKYIDLRTFVVKISRVTFTYFAHRFDCSGQVWSQGSQNWFKYFRDWGIPTLKNGEMPPLLFGSYVRYRGVWRRRAGKKSVFAKQKQTFDPWPPNGSRVWCLRVR